MPGLLKRLLDPSSAPHRNRRMLTAEQRQRVAMQRRQTADRKKNNEQQDEIRRLRDDLEASQAEVDELREDVDRLTRCLFVNGVIEQADLAAMLPKSEVQD